MTARALVLLVVFVFVIWLVVVAYGRDADPALVDTSTTDPGSTSTTTTTSVAPPSVADRAAGLTRKLQATRRQRRRDLYRYRRALRVIVHQDTEGDHWLERAFRCVHSGEGRWSSNTGNGYFGGLQFDLNFQRAYGYVFLRAFGTANKWPRSVQIAVAIRAYLSGRGFYPWPNTARVCGLIR